MTRNPVDIHVGTRIRSRRWTLQMTQQQLAESVGVKFQQVQKYESGANRVSASRLWDVAKTLRVPVSYFFDGLDDEAPAAPEMGRTGTRIGAKVEQLSPELAQHFEALIDAQLAKGLEVAA